MLSMLYVKHYELSRVGNVLHKKTTLPCLSFSQDFANYCPPDFGRLAAPNTSMLLKPWRAAVLQV